MKKTLALLAVLMIAAAGAALYAQETAPQQAETPKTAADLIKAGDEAFVKFDDAAAKELYEQAAKLEPTNYEALYKTARSYLDLGDRLPIKNKADEQQRIKLYLTSEDYAKKAVKVNPNDTWGYFYDSAAMGMHALQLSKKQQVNMSKQIKIAIDKAIALDPTNDFAYNALGQWHRTMAEIGGVSRFLGGILFGGIPKGSFDEAVKAFQKGLELKPNYANHHLELGRTYVSMKKKDLASKEFQAALDSPIRTSKCEDYKKEAAEELAKLKKK